MRASSRLPAEPDAVAGWIREQAAGCAELGSPFYAALLELVADDVEAGGPSAHVVTPFLDEAQPMALALRLMAAVHQLVLAGDAPALAARYPSTGGDGDARRAWPELRSVLADRIADVVQLVRRGCQTNEVGRSAALLGGFLELSRRERRPLRLLEIGASAGLNLRWDFYRYEHAGAAWGDPASPVRFASNFAVPPPFDVAVTVAERRGCDLNPIDAASEEGSLALRSFVWADQIGRMRRLEAAISVARRVPAAVERSDAVEFLRRELLTENPDQSTVVYHSVFLQYLDDASRASIDELIGRANAHRLSMEPAEVSVFEIRLDGRLLGTAGAHGTGVTWVVS